MSQTNESAISIRVDPTNPGQFFACCGLLELSDRLWRPAEGWFEANTFLFRSLEPGDPSERSLGALVRAIANTDMNQADSEDDFSSPIELSSPFNLRLDWWKDTRSGGDRLKVWAGSMRNVRIARAMRAVLGWEEMQGERLLEHSTVVYETSNAEKKVEPFYFDGRRGSTAQPIDIGFSPDSLQMTSLANPAVEFLCLVGLQRFRPMPIGTPRVFDYYTWEIPLVACIAPLAVCGMLYEARLRGFRFENAFRTDQRKHKAFTTATAFARNKQWMNY